MHSADVAIVGGGIVGLATGYNLAQNYPQQRVIVLEKEAELAFHQTGRNSGVLHSGIYYKPGTLRATNCRTGKEALERFCQAEGVDFDVCGKVIVAISEDEFPGMERIFERGKANGVRCEMIDQARLRELEPHTAGLRAIHVPEAGIVDYAQVCQRLADHIRRVGGEILLRAKANRMHIREDGVTVETTAGEVQAKYVINCAGLQSDRLTAMSGQKPEVKIVPFRGEYFELKPHAKHLCRNLIYPVPDPSFPFLGVHFTRMTTGAIECGPNAVLAFAREGYRFRDVNLADLAETLTYAGFLRMAAKHWKTGLGEMWRSLSKAAFVRALQRLVPEIKSEDLESAPAGVRAMALAPDGSLVDDFSIQEAGRVINVCNAPSPAATACLNIGRLIVEKLATRF
jgi:L-2-hydroxyglutarate oxidase